jgi:dethiobiotin synthetase
MTKQRCFFVTGIGTGIGKTFISAILTEAWNADYWKPVQCGNLEDSDSHFVKRMISNSSSTIHPEGFRLREPMSPHAAAKAEGVKIHLKDFDLPETKRTLVIEGAGGILVPLNDKKLVIDLIKKLDTEVIIIIKNYLGSINHSLLTIEAAKKRKLKIAGIIFNGDPVPSSEEIILKHSKLPLIGRVMQEPVIDPSIVSKYATLFKAIPRS